MAKVMDPRSSAAKDAKDGGDHCRGCWKDVAALADGDATRLNCGDVYCGPCMASLARGCLLVPTLLPLRCCRQPIPSTTIMKVLEPTEIAYYAMAVQREMTKKRTAVADGPLSARCDFCATPTRLVVEQDAQDQVLDCGHVYCQPCLASLRQSAKRSASPRVVCCRELVGLDTDPNASTATTTTTNGAAAPAATSPIRVATAAAAAPRRISPRTTKAVTTDATPLSDGIGKRKLRRSGVIVEILDDDDDDVEVVVEECSSCSMNVDASTNRFRAACGHLFCRACLHHRCQRALKNEEEGSIGLPVRCCGQLIQMDVIRPALTKRIFAKYEALVAKRGDATAPRQKGTKRAATTAAVEPDKKRPKKTKPQPKDSTAAGPATDGGSSTECVACVALVDAPTDRLRGPCGHVYCVTCLATMAKQSLSNRALVPIRCCSQEFPIEYVMRVLPKTQMAQYQRFLEEKDWRVSDLKSDQEYSKVVEKARGKQCPACGIGVQKIAGCNAIACPRGHYFCWKCGDSPCTCGKTNLAQYGG